MFGSSSAPSHLRMVVRPSGGAAWHRPGPKPRAAESALSARPSRRRGRVEGGWGPTAVTMPAMEITLEYCAV